MSVDQVREAVRAAEADVATWEAVASTRRAELVSLEERAGADVLAGGEAALVEIAEARRRLELEADMAGQAAEAARGRLVEARRAHMVALAGPMRERAAELDAEADAREVRTRDLLEELEAHEGVEWKVAERVSNQQVMMGSTLTYGTVTPYTRTESLRADARDLRKRAYDVEKAAAGAGDLDRYRRLVAAHDPGSPEAQERADAAEVARVDGEHHEACRSVLSDARSRWIAERTASLIEGHGDRRLLGMEGAMREQEASRAARRDFADAVAGTRWEHVERGSLGHWFGALEALGVEVELPSHPEGRDLSFEPPAPVEERMAALDVALAQRG